MELAIFARFHVKAGHEEAAASTLREQVEAARAEVGCVAIHAYKSTHDARLFWIHSRWADEDAFEVHAKLPRTDHFVAHMQELIDHPFEAVRTHVLA